MNKAIIDGIEYKFVPIGKENKENTYEAKEDASMSFADVKYRAEEEGIGYLLLHYCRYSDIKDTKTRILFAKAVEAIEELQEHLDN